MKKLQARNYTFESSTMLNIVKIVADRLTSIVIMAIITFGATAILFMKYRFK